MTVEPDTKRKFTRINFDRQVRLDFFHDIYYSKVNNISLTGMFIIGNLQEHNGNNCLIDLYQTEKSVNLNLSLRATAKVVRKDDKGIAIEFISMPYESYMFLQSALPKPNNYPFKTTDDLPISPDTNIFFNN